ncbi:MAG: CvpA family protein [Bacteroidia bacterium]|nr:CvpA family protein [Bacteroidia bacterium]MDW8301084.1 CvpA family protein [Bacteroidia bacterium]
MALIFDIFVCIVIGWGAWKGYQKGIIRQVLVVIGVIIFVVLGLKIATLVGKAIKNLVQPHFIPLFSLALTIFFIILAISIANKLSQKLLSTIMLNKVNRLAGGFVTAFLYASILSALCYMLHQAKIFSPTFAQQSITYMILVNAAPKIYAYTLSILPIVKEIVMDFVNMLKSLSIPQ